MDNIPLLAKRFIGSVPKVGIMGQLMWFKIDSIGFGSHLKPGTARTIVWEYHGELKKQRGVERDVSIVLPSKTTLHDKLVSVGHELGHTFQLFPDDKSLRDWRLAFGTPRDGGKWGRSLGLNSAEEVEAFCDVFGELWLQRETNKRDLGKLLMTTLGSGIIKI